MRLPSPQLLHLDLSPESREIYDHVYKNDIEKLKLCTKCTPTSANQQNSNGQTPLLLASAFNRVEILDVLLTSCCDVNIVDHEGNTALHEAVDKGNVECVRRLISTGRCLVDAKNNQGETALMKALFYDYVDIAGVLLNDGNASPDIRNDLGQSALLVGLQEGSHMAVDVILTYGCDVTVVDNIGKSALYIAVHSPCNKTLGLARRLITAGYNINVDRSWLLNEDKHNLFYHDEEFYARLLRSLRKTSRDCNIESDDVRNNSFECGTPSCNTTVDVKSLTAQTHTNQIKSSLYSISPKLRQKIISPSSKRYPVEPFERQSSDESDYLTTPPSSPEPDRRVCHTQNIAPPTLIEESSNHSISTDFTSSSTCNLDSSEHRSDVTSRVTCENEHRKLTSSRSLPMDAGNTASVRHPRKTSLSANSSPIVLKKADHANSMTNSIYSLTLRKRSVKPKLDDVTSGVIIRRQASVQVPSVTLSDFNISRRKVSAPTKSSVHFNPEIQIIDFCRRQ